MRPSNYFCFQEDKRRTRLKKIGELCITVTIEQNTINLERQPMCSPFPNLAIGQRDAGLNIYSR